MRETQEKQSGIRKLGKTRAHDKTHIKIKLKVFRYLKQFPMTQYDLSKATGSNYNAVGKALIYLENVGKVECVELNVYDPNTKEDKILWRLKKSE